MTCPHCTRSAQELWHGFQASCRGCQARALSRSPDFDYSRRRKVQIQAYRDALKTLGLTHEDVVAAWKKDGVNQ